MHKNLNLIKPIVFFDLETTGVSISTDRIVQMACIKILPDGSRETKSTLVKPVDREGNQIPIPEGATEVHGITDEMVKDAPTFKQLSKSIFVFFDNCDLGGYNSNSFDTPLLAQEFDRVGMDFDLSNRSYMDGMKIEMVVNPRTLEAVYNRYTGKTLEGAHDALVDVEGTIDVVIAQIEQHNLTGTVEEIDIFSQGDRKRVDLAGKLQEIDGEICWAFGKHKDLPVSIDHGYKRWFLGTDVPIETRKIIENL